jgi:hypothetical protein
LAAFVAGVELNEGVVDALGLQPGEEEVAEFVGADRGGDAGGLGVAGEDFADAPVGVGLLPAGLEQVDGAFGPEGLDVEGEGLFERLGEWDSESPWFWWRLGFGKLSRVLPGW